MKDNEQDQLWEVLGSSREPLANPFFARNVIREIRRNQRDSGVWAWLKARPALLAIGSAATACILALSAASLVRQHERSEHPAQIANKDYEIIHDLDNLLAIEENDLWVENSQL